MHRSRERSKPASSGMPRKCTSAEPQNATAGCRSIEPGQATAEQTWPHVLNVVRTKRSYAECRNRSCPRDCTQTAPRDSLSCEFLIRDERMGRGLFWLNDRQSGPIEPHLATGLTGRIGTATGALSAGSFTCCSRVRDGATAGVNTALTRPSAIASIAGSSAGDDGQGSQRWPSLAKTGLCCRSIRPRLKLTVWLRRKRGRKQSAARAEAARQRSSRPASDARPRCRCRGGARCPGARATHECAPR